MQTHTRCMVDRSGKGNKSPLHSTPISRQGFLPTEKRISLVIEEGKEAGPVDL